MVVSNTAGDNDDLGGHMRYDILTHEIVMERTDCSTCNWQPVPGTMPGKRTCRACGGTGEGPRGGKNKCRGEKIAGSKYAYDTCYRGQIIDFDIRIPCYSCEGKYENAQMESPYDYAPGGMLAGLIDSGAVGLRVHRVNRGGTAQERLLGVGLWSSTDYGDAWKMPDEDVREKVLGKIRDDSTQVVKFTAKAERGAERVTVCAEIVVILHRDGYSVVGVTKDAPVYA